MKQQKGGASVAEKQRASNVILKSVVGLCLTVAACAGVVAWNLWDNSSFTESIYSFSSGKLSAGVRAVLITDLHQKEYGEANSTLISRVRKLKPDVILIAGDMINKYNPDGSVAVALCKELVTIAPVYYSLGNHENEVVFGSDMISDDMQAADDGTGEIAQFIQGDSFLRAVEKTGVTILTNEKAELKIGEDIIDIGGVNTNLSSFWPYSGDFITEFATENTDRFKILLCHRPEVVGYYLAETPLDLSVSGHTHGGALRVPGIGGIFSKEQGLNPELDAGVFDLGATKLVISRGIGGFPRVLNRPELVIIDVTAS